ncbi:MAG TPA: hypothetical protein VKE25_16010, partial [Actinomycetes bacterium]|nr:hypothetical protein [Actinomycetes bacterium]
MHRIKMSASVAYEVESTLTAAVADPEVAAAVRTGRLERPEQYAGLGPGPPLRLVPAADDEDLAEEEADAEAEGAASAEARRARELVTARRRHDKAAADLRRREVERDQLLAEQTELTKRLDDLRHHVKELERRLTKASDEVAAAEVRLNDATDAVATAERAVADGGPKKSGRRR